ncbi:hypothetical protein [Aeromicrobium sp. IC_218]|uniref:hypothetical protein n=1 Tax=Aeromicrobium sp. IC_218 TaxID=2545468 RepID=UPI001A954DE2|nr:hypothetical protein [Aeromicrobium sp. IC_218]
MLRPQPSPRPRAAGTVAALVALVVVLALVATLVADSRSPALRGRRYPWHTDITATTFWVGEIFDPDADDGSQRISAYDDAWLEHYGGCDGRQVGDDCRTERRFRADGWFPRHMRPLENPFYLDLPYDDKTVEENLRTRGDVVPWAGEEPYRSRVDDPRYSLMKNRWVELRRGSRRCFGQVEDAGPGEYSDVDYVFGSDDARPLNQRYGGAGMDVSPALTGCLGFDDVNGVTGGVHWRFVDEVDVPPGPWRRLVTRSPGS